MMNRATALAVLALASVTTVAQAATGAGPYYALPAWSQKLACTSPVNCPRFVVLSDWDNEAVLDRETGLLWERTIDNDALTFIQASSRCMLRGTGGRQGWRLPTVQELTSLREPSNPVAPRLPAGHPFSAVLPIASFWSANRFVDDEVDNFWWTVRFDEPFGFNAISAAGGNTSRAAWCVRGGLNPGVQ